MRTHVRLWMTLAVAVAGPLAARGDERGKKTIVRLFTDAAAKAADATVRIKCDNKDAALGTIVDAKGYILTKGSELKGTVSVRMRDGSEYDAETVGYHEATDLALLKIDATDLATVAFAPGKDATVGNWVAASGPESEPLAAGLVSAGVRKLYGPEAFIDKLNKGYLGVTADPDADEAKGVVIGSVDRKGAANNKLAAGDVILKVAGTPVKKFEEMRKILEGYKPGDSVKVLYRRGKDEKEVTLKLVDRANFDRGDFQNKMGSELSNRRTGFPAVIMHDTVLRPRDCGGPLVDLDGKVLGVNIARAGRVETWALPGEIVTPIVKELIAGKYPIKTTEKVKAEDKK